MAKMQIDINPAQIREVEAMFAGVKNGAPRVLTRVVNKTLTGVRTDMTDEAYQELNTTKKVIRDAIKINRASWTKITGKAFRTGKPLPLAKFTGTRQTKKGVSVKVLRTGGRSILKHAFISKMRSGHIGVFWRQRRDFFAEAASKLLPERAYGALPETYRLPIIERFGPRVEDILSKPARIKNIQAKAGDRLLKNMDAEINYELSRL